MAKLGLTLDAGDYALLLLALFAGILVALAIAVILGAFAENVRSVQALISPLSSDRILTLKLGRRRKAA